VRLSWIVALAGCGHVGFESVVDGHAPADAGPVQTIVGLQGNGFFNTVSTTTAQVMLPGVVGPQHAIVVGALYPAARTATVSDTLGNTYQTAVTIAQTGTQFTMFYAVGSLAGLDTATVTFDAPPNVNIELAMAEYSGIAGTASIDTTLVSTGTISAPGLFASDLVTTARDGEMLVAYALGSCVTENSPSAGRVAIHGDIIEDQLVTAGQHQMIAHSSCPGPNAPWQILIAAFLPAAA
jgi:hypothetical protein